jgi:hypothetical protein
MSMYDNIFAYTCILTGIVLALFAIVYVIVATILLVKHGNPPIHWYLYLLSIPASAFLIVAGRITTDKADRCEIQYWREFDALVEVPACQCGYTGRIATESSKQ